MTGEFDNMKFTNRSIECHSTALGKKLPAGGGCADLKEKDANAGNANADAVPWIS